MAPSALSAPPRRVVSLVPSVTGSLFDLGLGDRLVGVTDYCVYPADKVAGLPKVGGTKSADVAAILALQPDLVIANQEENTREVVAELEAAGVPVWVTFPCTARAALDLLWQTIRLFDAPHLSRSLDVLERSYEWASLAAEAQPGARVFCPIWRRPAAGADPIEWWMTASGDTYLSDVLRVCGGSNVFAGRERHYPLEADLDPAHPAQPADGRDTRYPRVTPAEVVAAAPEVILLPSEPYPFDALDQAELAAFAEIPAVAHGRVHLVDGSLLTWPGTRLAQALAELPSLLQIA